MSDRDVYGLDQARLQAAYSKDPSTKVGAAILRPNGTLVSVGRNGFARGIQDLDERLHDREVKQALTVHAEENAIVTAGEHLGPGHTIYVWPWQPCVHCASVIVNSGLGRVVTISRRVPDRWTLSMERARRVLVEAKVEFVEIDEFAYLGRSKLPPAFMMADDDLPRHA